MGDREMAGCRLMEVSEINEEALQSNRKHANEFPALIFQAQNVKKSHHHISSFDFIMQDTYYT